jgi:hypothetical protein
MGLPLSVTLAMAYPRRPLQQVGRRLPYYHALDPSRRPARLDRVRQLQPRIQARRRLASWRSSVPTRHLLLLARRTPAKDIYHGSSQAKSEAGWLKLLRSLCSTSSEQSQFGMLDDEDASRGVIPAHDSFGKNYSEDVIIGTT